MRTRTGAPDSHSATMLLASRGHVRGLAVRLAVFAAVFVFVSLMTSKRSRQPEPAHEVGAIGRVRAVISAQSTYASLCGGYADTLERLARPSCKPKVVVPTPFLSPDVVATRETSAYRFELVPSEDLTSHYAYIAVPTQVLPRRMRAFCGDDSDRIYVDVRGNRPAVRDGQCRDRRTPLS